MTGEKKMIIKRLGRTTLTSSVFVKEMYLSQQCTPQHWNFNLKKESCKFVIIISYICIFIVQISKFQASRYSQLRVEKVRSCLIEINFSVLQIFQVLWLDFEIHLSQTYLILYIYVSEQYNIIIINVISCSSAYQGETGTVCS